jgi:hypothetical protein
MSEPLTPVRFTEQIIDEIPEAMGIWPDPWPEEGPCRARDGLPHRAIAKLIADRDAQIRRAALEEAIREVRALNYQWHESPRTLVLDECVQKLEALRDAAPPACGAD